MKITDEQLQHLQKSFAMYDVNRDNQIDRTELLKVFKDLNMSDYEKEADKLMERLDSNKDGSISFAEFIKALRSLKDDGESITGSALAPWKRLLWGNVDSTLDKIIALANSLKGQTGEVKTKFDAHFSKQEEEIKKRHTDKETIEAKLVNISASSSKERQQLQQTLSTNEEENKKKVEEYDNTIHKMVTEREKLEREAEEHKGNAAEEKQKITNLLRDLEEDALSYQRFRPSKPVLDKSEIDIIRQMFLSSAVAGSGKLSFQDLKKIITKYEASEPRGNLKKLFQIVENDKKNRISYITVVALANDLAALVGDFRKIDTNGNGTLSRKELRDHLSKLGFSNRSSLDVIFRFGDQDDSEDITFAEFVHLSVILLVLRVLFLFADYDKNGRLSKQEILQILAEAAIPPSALSKFDDYYLVVDRDNSKSLDFNEFVLLVMSMFEN